MMYPYHSTHRKVIATSLILTGPSSPMMKAPPSSTEYVCCSHWPAVHTREDPAKEAVIDLTGECTVDTRRDVNGVSVTAVFCATTHLV